MSEFTKTDVGDFFVNRTENFEKSPPDSMWESIEKQIPQYSVTNPLLKYFIGGIGLSVLIFGLFLIFYNYNTGTKNITNQNISEKKEITNNESEKISNNAIVSINSENTEKDNIVADVNTEKIKNNNIIKNSSNNTDLRKHETENTTSKDSEKSVKYSINATGLNGVSEIIFENSKKENILTLANPKPNAFGFYDIDISKLPNGTYNIFITINGEKKLHKTETFK
ncbi:MAG: hypothetical protein HY951_04655 [Bacteroidia bacterium]|nr:hypothetical protein [Bacteroidia bacterium]